MDIKKEILSLDRIAAAHRMPYHAPANIWRNLYASLLFCDVVSGISFIRFQLAGLLQGEMLAALGWIEPGGDFDEPLQWEDVEELLDRPYSAETGVTAGERAILSCPGTRARLLGCQKVFDRRQEGGSEHDRPWVAHFAEATQALRDASARAGEAGMMRPIIDAVEDNSQLDLLFGDDGVGGQL